MNRHLLPARTLSLVLIFAWTASAVHGQGIDPLGKTLGLTPDQKALPVWAQPGIDARQLLGKATRAMPQGVVLVGGPKMGHGTAWVISRENRLLATNAHVADIMHPSGKMYAILNGTATTYTVTKAWYHPGVRRFLKRDYTMSIRSMDPAEGPVDPNSPDVAVLQLSSEGADLPVELTLATQAELKDMFAQPAAILGFPGHDTYWPPPGDKAQATYHDGVISRLTDFRRNPSVPENELQQVQYTMATWPGFSGSPVYLPNGHVIALHNMARSVKSQHGETKSIPHGVRVDCLWELLVHHNLDSKVAAKFDKSQLNIKRWLVKDERDEKFRGVVNLVAEARYLIYTKQDFVKGVEKCNEAIKRAPNYAEAYRTRSNGFTNYWFKNRPSLSQRDALEMLDNARWDAEKYVKLAGSSDPDAIITLCLVNNNIGSYTENNSYNRKAYNILNQLLTSNNLTDYTRATALSSRGVALDNLGEKRAAIKDHNEAIRLYPEEPVLWETRADFWNYNNRQDLRRADNAKARELRRIQLLRSQNVGKGKQILSTEGKLTDDDAFDRVRTESYHKVHTVELEQGATYQIDMRGKLDPYLRLEDANGKQLADDDDGGFNYNARVYITAPSAGTYRIIATTYDGGKTGSYTLTVWRIASGE